MDCLVQLGQKLAAFEEAVRMSPGALTPREEALSEFYAAVMLCMERDQYEAAERIVRRFRQRVETGTFGT